VRNLRSNFALSTVVDEAVLLGVPFPRNFRETVRTIVRRLFRVYAHIYSNHFDQICALGIEGNDTWFTFGSHHKLIEILQLI